MHNWVHLVPEYKHSRGPICERVTAVFCLHCYLTEAIPSICYCIIIHVVLCCSYYTEYINSVTLNNCACAQGVSIHTSVFMFLTSVIVPIIRISAHLLQGSFYKGKETKWKICYETIFLSSVEYSADFHAWPAFSAQNSTFSKDRRPKWKINMSFKMGLASGEHGLDKP